LEALANCSALQKMVVETEAGFGSLFTPLVIVGGGDESADGVGVLSRLIGDTAARRRLRGCEDGGGVKDDGG